MVKKARKDNKKLMLQAAGLTDIGRVRKNNEDSFLIEDPGNGKKSPYLICVVADGMGGQDYGEIASQMAIKTFHQEARQLTDSVDIVNWLNNSVLKTHLEVRRQLAHLQTSGMGSTLVAGIFTDQQCYIANVGDSRAYLFRGGALYRQTKDHSLMEVMLDKGLIKPEEVYTHPRRGELTRYIGQPTDLEVDIYKVDNLKSGDVVLFCSDGLWEMVRDPDIALALQTNSDPLDAATSLINKANRSGGVDNVTAVIVSIS